ncbi:MAG: peptide ABC transporter substrate-binding protein [Spirochaetales bacterium]|nr:peptide ABC transporter substrate-binding protein [Spirochaetales bacterium]
MNRILRTLPLQAAVVALVLAAFACSPSPKVVADDDGASSTSQVSAPAEQKLTFALQNEPDGLDPGITSNSFASPVLMNVFEGLVKYDADNNLVSGCAKDWSISDDGLTYTFTLQDDLKWSDGSPLKAQDFVYSYLRVLDPALGAQYTAMITDYIAGAAAYYAGEADVSAVGISAPADDTLILTLKAPAPYFLGILGMWVYSPVNQATIDAAGDQWTLSAETFVSNGPFRMEEIAFGEGYTLVKNEHYWDAANVRLEEVAFRFIPDPSTALTALENGDIDGQYTIPSADLPTLKATSDALQIVPTYASTYYEINCSKAPFDDVRVRQALAMALDRQAIIENVLQSTDQPAFSLVAPGYSVNGVAYEEGRSDYGLSATANVEGAQALLAEAGYPNGEGFPAVELSYYTNETVKSIVEAMQQMWQENLGITVNVVTEEWAVYYEGIQALDYDIGAMGWGADYMHPMTFFPLRVSDNGLNNSGWASEEYDRLVAAAQVETDPMKAMTLMRQAEDILMNDMALLPLYFRSAPMMMAPYVKGWHINPLRNMYLSGAYIES